MVLAVVSAAVTAAVAAVDMVVMTMALASAAESEEGLEVVTEAAAAAIMTNITTVVHSQEDQAGASEVVMLDLKATAAVEAMGVVLAPVSEDSGVELEGVTRTMAAAFQAAMTATVEEVEEGEVDTHWEDTSVLA